MHTKVAYYSLLCTVICILTVTVTTYIVVTYLPYESTTSYA